MPPSRLSHSNPSVSVGLPSTGAALFQTWIYTCTACSQVYFLVLRAGVRVAMDLIKDFMTNGIPPLPFHSPCWWRDEQNCSTPAQEICVLCTLVTFWYAYPCVYVRRAKLKETRFTSHEMAIKVNALRGTLLLRYVSWDDGFGKLLDQFLSAD